MSGLGLCERIVHDGPAAMETAIKWGITADDFVGHQARALWNVLFAYYTQTQTKGSVVDAETLAKHFKGHIAVANPQLNVSVEALCHEVRRERMLTESSEAVVAYSEEAYVFDADLVAAAQKLRGTIDGIIRLGSSGSAPLRTAVDLAAPLPPARWIVEALGLQPGAPMLLAGYGSSLKSLAAQGLALALAAPDNLLVWGGFLRTRRCHVLHLDYEQGEFETQRRYQRLARGMEVDLAGVGSFLSTRSLGDRLLTGNRGVFEMYAKDFDVILIDSFAAAGGTKTEENNAEAREPLDMLTAISEETGCTFIVIHHAGKGGKADAREVARGSSAIFDAAGSMLAFTRDMGQKNEVRVEPAKNRGGRENAPFTLRIADTMSGGTTVLTAAVPTADTQAGVLAERVVEHLALYGGSWTGSGKAMKEALGVSNRNHQVLQRALAQLEQSGRVQTSPGRGQQTTYTLTVREAVPAPRDNLADAVPGSVPGYPAGVSTESGAKSSSSLRVSGCPEVVPGQPHEVVPVPPPLRGGTTSAIPCPGEHGEEEGQAVGELQREGRPPSIESQNPTSETSTGESQRMNVPLQQRSWSAMRSPPFVPVRPLRDRLQLPADDDESSEDSPFTSKLIRRFLHQPRGPARLD